MKACMDCPYRKQRGTFGFLSICTHPFTKEVRPLIDLKKERDALMTERMGQRVKTSARVLLDVDGPWEFKRVWRWPWSFDAALTKTCRGWAVR